MARWLQVDLKQRVAAQLAKAIATGTRDPRFESHHQQNCLSDNNKENIRINEEEAGCGPIMRNIVSSRLEWDMISKHAKKPSSETRLVAKESRKKGHGFKSRWKKIIDLVS